MSNRRLFSVSAVPLAVALSLVVTASPASAAQAQVGLGTATSYAVLAGTTVTNTGPTTIIGDVGVSPGTAVVGFPPGQVTDGTIHSADAPALQAQSDLTTAYNDAAGRGPTVDAGVNLGGQTLVGGVYNSASAMALNGTVTLDGQGDPNAVFIFQAGSTLITASSSNVAFIGAARACNVFWQVGSSATIGTNSTFAGTVMALTSITMQTGATIEGRLLARNGQVSLDDNTITRTYCPFVAPTASSTPTATTTPSPSDDSGDSPSPGPTTMTANPGGGSGSGSAGGSGADTGTDTGTSGDTSTPVVPSGHPETGRAPAADHEAQLWLVGGLVCALGAAGAAGAAVRGSRRRVSPPRS